MQRLELVTVCVLSLLVIFIWYAPEVSFSQSQSTNVSKMAPVSEKSIVTVSSSVTVDVHNQTIKTKEATLKSAVIGFLNSGPNVLKTSDGYQVGTKTKISNQINNSTQSVEGIEATNAIIGVEIGKALKSTVARGSQSNQSDTITVATSSTCKPVADKSIACDNIITIK